MGDFHAEVMHAEYERNCTNLEEMRRLYPEKVWLREDDWTRFVNDCAFNERAWIGCVANWLNNPMWNQKELYSDAMEELDRLRKEMKG